MRDTRRYPKRPLVGAGAVVHKGDRALLVKRRYPPNAGRWSIPGGMVELGESARDAASREVSEETGLSVAIERLLDVVTDVHRDKTGLIEYHFILVDYVARPVGGRLAVNAESSECGWFTKDEVDKIDMSKGTRETLMTYFGGTGPKSRRYARRSPSTRSA